jgi:hypothetical protein
MTGREPMIGVRIGIILAVAVLSHMVIYRKTSFLPEKRV